MSIQTKF